MKKRYRLLFLFFLSACSHPKTEDQLVAIHIQDRNGMTETISSKDRLEVYETTDFLHSQPYKKVLRVYQNEKQNRSVITTYHSNGTPWQYLEAEAMRAHGEYKEWFPNGQLKIQARVIGGTADLAPGSQQDWLFDSLSQVWDEQGRLLAEIPYVNGMLEGTSVHYYPNGQIEETLPYKQNVLQGEALEYYSNGNFKSKATYSKGLREGLSLGYFSNGNKAWVEEYSEGLILKGVYYNLKGEILSEVENGGGFQASFTNDVLSQVTEIRQGRPEGLVQLYTPSGELQNASHMKNGLKEGEEIEYYLSSEKKAPTAELLPKLSISWHQNAIHGTVKTWYDNGQLQSQRDYCRNQKAGSSVCWYRDGSLMLLEEYENDRLLKGQYYKKSQKEPVSSISNGNGIATLYDDMGLFLRKVTYAKGKPFDPEN